MNVAKLDLAMNGNKARTEDELNKLYVGMVKDGGIAYCEFPKILDAKKIRDELVLHQDDFERFKQNPENKKFPEEELEGLKNQWKAILRDMANASGKAYAESKDWTGGTIHMTPIVAQANLMFTEDFIEGVGTPDKYNDKVMNHHRIISKLENDWNMRQGWPVIFQPEYVDDWQSTILTGHSMKYFLPRKRFTRLAGGGQTGVWVDKWSSEILGKQVKLSNKGTFLDVMAKWIEEYFVENPQ